jgi:probable addiction module antidote protein
MATTRFDSAKYLDSPETQAEYLSEFLMDGSADEIRHAISTIARARGMTEIARSTGIRREQLYRALGDAGNPEFATVLTVIRALGVNLVATCQKTSKAARSSRPRKRPARRVTTQQATKAKAARR